MKKNSPLIILTICMTLMILASCGKDSSKNTTPVGTGGEVNSLTTSSSRSYQFNINGCDTGKKEFTSNSAEKSKQLMCDALQSNSINNFCAGYAREQFFSVACEGQTWNPYC